MSSEKKGIDPNTIIVAALGLLGTIAAALIGVYGSRNNSIPTSVPPTAPVILFTETSVPTAIPTDTVPPGEPTSTPIPPTDTPIPTVTPIPPVALGQDWSSGCISTLWKPYPANIPVIERGDGCWQEPVHVFLAENGDLDFLAERGNGPQEEYGLFALLPENGTVTITVRLRELDNVDVWLGVFAEPDISSNGLLMTIPAGNVKKRVIVQKDPHNYETLQATGSLDQGDGYSISFTFTALSISSSVDPSVFVTNPVSVPSAQKWLFLGYRGLRGSYRVDATFLSFELR